MSVFEDGTKQTQETPQVENTAPETQEDYVSKLVEARGENWSDPQVIAKGKLESDRHISELERQLAELREDLSKNQKAEELLNLATGQGDTDSQTLQQPNNNNNTEVVGSDEANTTQQPDINDLVEKALAEREMKAKVEANISVVNAALEETFGTEAKTTVENKAQELGLSMDRMQELAKESPDAFMALMGQPKREGNFVREGSVNTITQSRSTEKNFKHYQELRRTNPNQYYSPSVQNEMAQARMQLGDRFYN